MENKSVIRKIDSKIIFITPYYKPPTNNMSFRLSSNFLKLPNTLDNQNSLQLPGNLQLPIGVTLESLYKINPQSIWFLIWILKKVRFWPDLIKETLERPFAVKKSNPSDNYIYFFSVVKNNLKHGVHRTFFKNPQLGWQLLYESYWKNKQQHGITRTWHKNAQLKSENRFKNYIRHGIARCWYKNGQLREESHWQNGSNDGIYRSWFKNGHLRCEYLLKNGERVT